MSKQDRIRLYQHHITEAQGKQAQIQRQLVNAALAPDDPQMATWRNRLAYWERVEREYRSRLERVLRES